VNDLVVACTLGASDLQEQARRWGTLRQRAELRQVETPAGKRIYFAAGNGVAEELGALVATERQCCAWASWTVEREGDEVVLEVASSGEGVAAIRGMF
jgi:hypothetical protein